jgi:hypothetical protein
VGVGLGSLLPALDAGVSLLEGVPVAAAPGSFSGVGVKVGFVSNVGVGVCVGVGDGVGEGDGVGVAVDVGAGVLVGTGVGVRVGVGVGVRVGAGVDVRVGVGDGDCGEAGGVCNTPALCGGAAGTAATASGLGVGGGSSTASEPSVGSACDSSVLPTSEFAGCVETRREVPGVAVTTGACGSVDVISTSLLDIGTTASAISRSPIRKQQMCTVLVQRPSGAWVRR